MKKKIVCASFIGIFLVGTPLAFAQTVDQNPDPTTTMLQITQQIMQLVVQMNQTIVTDEATISNLQSRVSALESKVNAQTFGAIPTIQSTPVSTPENADQVAIDQLEATLSDTPSRACMSPGGIQRRTYDRIFNLMCGEANVK